MVMKATLSLQLLEVDIAVKSPYVIVPQNGAMRK
jgi:hypothetical protein